MKYKDLIRKIREACAAVEIDFELKRQRGSHTMWTCGTKPVTIPGAGGEVNELTALGICKDLESELGEKWWR
ncbi:type II toxin-antitoxin system HicA family toxin [Streptacidiphilus sp. EB129]|uniref:type II toxin-antitoxin system HicA family toxin n=1 Tax=Streptacidiphilus sp. EB129 TaxID=3156262 RepID=UPI003515D02F